eukprot:359172-Chlamydomonas_euryale.AAC.5
MALMLLCGNKVFRHPVCLPPHRRSLFASYIPFLLAVPPRGALHGADAVVWKRGLPAPNCRVHPDAQVVHAGRHDARAVGVRHRDAEPGHGGVGVARGGEHRAVRVCGAAHVVRRAHVHDPERAVRGGAAGDDAAPAGRAQGVR